MKKPMIFTFVVLAMVCLVADVFAMEQLHIAFDPPLMPGGVTPMDDWLEEGMFFTGPHGFSQYDSGRSGCPDNGTAYLHFAKGPSQTLTFKFVDSTPFVLISVDLAEYSTFFAEPKTITFLCYKTDGTVSTTDFTVDGLIDGSGGILDFETFAFGPEFTEISYVEVPTTGYSMDNVVLAQLPGYETLIGLEITGPNNVVETTSAQYNAIAFFEGGNTLKVNSSASWSLDPNMFASIKENGLLTAEDINQPEDITIYAQYSKGQVTMVAEISVHISLHTPLIMHVPEEYDTIQAAIDQSIISDLIIVHPGTYYENINFGGKSVTLRSIEPTDPDIVVGTIVDGSLNGSVVTFSGEESPNCVLSGFTITNGGGSSIPIGGGICGNGTLATIEYNVISNNRVNPGWFPSSAFGGGLSNCNGTIRYNIISENGVYCDEGSAAGGGLYNCNGKIYNNVIVNNEASGLAWGICAGGAFYNCNGIIQNNSIIGNLAYLEGGGLSACNGAIENCVIWQNLANTDPQLNACSSPSYSCIQNWIGSGQYNIDTDPYFVKPGYWDSNDLWINGDYHLLENSPCIDTGDPNYVAGPNETDLDGNPRIVNDRIDMGAYEFAPAIEALVKIRPRTLNLRSKGKWIMCRISLPEDYSVADIDPNSVFLEDEIPADHVWLQDEFAVVKFSRPAVLEMLAELETPAEVELLVSGELTDGTIFEGADVVRVIDKRSKKKSDLRAVMVRRNESGLTGIEQNVKL